jgi:hypothetical protein
MVRRRALFLLWLVLAYPGAALTQQRVIPDDAKRGYVRHVGGFVISIDGNEARLAAGAVIRDQKNLIVVPTSLPPAGAWADYTKDASGQVSRVWLLTPQEQARPVKAQQ